MNSEEMPLLLYPFPAAVIHLDADAFFTSVEQALHPRLKGRPVVTGKERGIIACASYEAKRIGIKRGLSLREAKAMCPELAVLPSDYETYAIFSRRMFDVMRDFTPAVEESSIDEAFADISGMRRVFRASYEEIALRMKNRIRECLDITVSIGLSVTKTLAKLASDRNKPDGLTVVEGTRIHLFLREIPVGDICGIGPNGTALLAKYGVSTAWDFIRRDEKWISGLLKKPGRDLWNELRGVIMSPVTVGERPPQASISKTKTFSAVSKDRDFIYARLTRNIESAFIKLRRHKLKTSSMAVTLRRANYDERGFVAKLDRATITACEAMPLARVLFERLYEPGAEYRSVTVVLGGLETQGDSQMELFADNATIGKAQSVARAIDDVNSRFGKHAVSMCGTLFLKTAPKTEKDEQPERKRTLLAGENARRRIGIPMLGISV